MDNKPIYSEGTQLEAIVGVIGPILATTIIAVLVILTNNANNPPSW